MTTQNYSLTAALTFLATAPETAQYDRARLDSRAYCDGFWITLNDPSIAPAIRREWTESLSETAFDAGAAVARRFIG